MGSWQLLSGWSLRTKIGRLVVEILRGQKFAVAVATRQVSTA
jgi:hypothetical protein